jgi:heme/copper-type cytochrome/quinol oxidase subunit 4
VVFNSITIVWGLLFIGTTISWFIAPEEDYLSPLLPGIAIILIAFLKVRLILLYFMDLRVAPQPWRGLFEAWMISACALILTLYTMGT